MGGQGWSAIPLTPAIAERFWERVEVERCFSMAKHKCGMDFNGKTARDSGACDRHVDFGAESRKDSVRRFAVLASTFRLGFADEENGISCSHL